MSRVFTFDPPCSCYLKTWTILLGISYVVTRIYFIIFPLILIFYQIIFFIDHDNSNFNHIDNWSLNMSKSLFLMLNVVVYCITIVLFIIKVYPVYLSIWHIMPNNTHLPTFQEMNQFSYFICDIHATYDALVYAPSREYYICQILGPDIGGIVLLYTGSTKDIEKLIDPNNRTIQFFIKTHRHSIQHLYYGYNSYALNNLSMIEMIDGNASTTSKVSKSKTIKNGVHIKSGMARSHFPSFRGNFNLLFGYKWYYEVLIHTNGITQLGFATNLCQTAERSGRGIGDDEHSWVIDPYRRSGWHNRESRRLVCGSSRELFDGHIWTSASVITIVFDCVTRESCKMEGYIDGMPISIELEDDLDLLGHGVIFDNIDLSDEKIMFIYPCVTLSNSQDITIVFDQQSMKFPMSQTEGYRAINAHLLSNSWPEI